MYPVRGVAGQAIRIVAIDCGPLGMFTTGGVPDSRTYPFESQQEGDLKQFGGPEIGVPQNHPNVNGIVHEIIQPLGGNPPFMETTIWPHIPLSELAS